MNAKFLETKKIKTKENERNENRFERYERFDAKAQTLVTRCEAMDVWMYGSSARVCSCARNQITFIYLSFKKCQHLS